MKRNTAIVNANVEILASVSCFPFAATQARIEDTVRRLTLDEKCAKYGIDPRDKSEHANEMREWLDGEEMQTVNLGAPQFRGAPHCP